ncbi:ribonuclease R [Aquilutibacter rugosus]|uniref:ribonuclease R n=1 Tax=Aquilutibacter rugosus TaxID=3115820 RepID=UPI002F3F8F17
MKKRTTRKGPAKANKGLTPAAKAGKTSGVTSRSADRKDGSGGPQSRTPGRRGAKSSLPPWMPQVVPAGKPETDPYANREAARYEKPIASRELILQTLLAADGPLQFEELGAQLHISDESDQNAFRNRIKAMLRDGQLVQNRSGELAPTLHLDLIPGRVIANPEGFGFLRPDVDSGIEDDIFLPPSEMRKVINGDRVLVQIVGVDRRGREEGKISRVLERGVTRLIGYLTIENGISFVVPDDRRIQRNILIPVDARLDAVDGQLVVAEITQMPDDRKPPIGRIVAVLGDKLTASLAVQAAIHGHNIPHEFPPEVTAQAEAVPLEVTEADIEGRVDLRWLPLVTIDGEDAKDFDDAVWCERQTDGGYRLIVAIADVSHYVRPGSPLDTEAQTRGTSVYFPGFVVPMLPEVLSNGICSLKPKVDRLCFVCDLHIDPNGVTTKSSFYTAVMHSHARLTYTQVWNALGDESVSAEDHAAAVEYVGPLMPHVQALHGLYKILVAARARRGAIEFESSEVRFVLDNSGKVLQAGMLQRNDAHKLIEECMIAANVEAARFIDRAQMPAPHRVHERPPERKYNDLVEFLSEFGLRLPAWARVTPKDYRNLLLKIRDRPDYALIESVLLRSQSLAVYSTASDGHFGLALDAYAHFTSPIRRYADLLLHRAIKHALSGEPAERFTYSPSNMANLALAVSERSRRAEEAEREVDDRYRAAWMSEHVGGRFSGVISGVTSFGLFVELDESKVNGLVHVTTLPRDYYHFDAIRKTLTGERTGREFRLGDRLEIIVMKASVEERKIDFKLAADGSKESGLPARKKGKR